MNIKFSKLAALTAVAFLSCAALLPADTTSVMIGTGYRQDSITLDVKERGSLNPRGKSNRHFKDLEIVLIRAQGKSTMGCCDAYVRASFDYGFVLDGSVRDQISLVDHDSISPFHHSGYSTDGEFLKSTVHNDIKNNSFVWDLNVAFAYPFAIGCGDFKIAPAIGFSLDRQQLRIKGASKFSDGLACHNSKFHNITDKHGNSSSFRASWWGPWVGFDFIYDSPNCWNLYGCFEFHFGRARRQASACTQRTYLDSYSRTKCFFGPLFKLGTSYMFCENWVADASVSYLKYFSNADRDHIAWASANVCLDIGYVF